jgi:hypothetical protein
VAASGADASEANFSRRISEAMNIFRNAKRKRAWGGETTGGFTSPLLPVPTRDFFFNGKIKN